jgi:AraC-like DNA-binding protein
VLQLDQLVDLLLRGGTVGVMAQLAIALAREPRQPARLTGSVFCLGAVAFALSQSPVVRHAFGPAIMPVDLLADVVCGLFWAFALELFGDSASLKLNRFLPTAALFALTVAAIASPAPVRRFIQLIQLLISIGLMGHVLLVTWLGRRDDLVESRRRLRVPIIAASAIFALLVSGALSAELLFWRPLPLSLYAAAAQFVLSVAMALVFENVDGQFFGRPAKAPIAQASTAVEPRDLATLERLRQALDIEEVWRSEDLSIGSLADIVGVPQHRLRKIVNEGLGYRNFAAFLGERRVAAAQAVLSDPAAARRPISTIAFEVGFSSLASFNRVFRDVAGTTPTDFRNAALKGASNLQTSPQI